MRYQVRLNFYCNIFFISRIIEIFNSFKLILRKMKRKLFNKEVKNTTGVKAALENITILLGAIGVLLLALKTIIEIILQTKDILT